ncbi:purine-binding chemotaxis protein CheW [bacterium]|nr:purine-binding chemotaxis protein CheW [bacterium]
MDLAKAQEQALVHVEDAQHNTFDLLVVFELCGQEYGLMASTVREIIRNRSTTRVPNSNKYIDGVINLRGKIIPIFSMFRRLNLTEPEAEEVKHLTIMVVESEGNEAGLLVTRVTDVVKLAVEDINHTASRIGNQHSSKFIEGTVSLGNRLISLLRLPPLLAEDGKARTS